MNKKGIKIPTETVIGLAIFAVILLGIFTPLFGGIYDFFFGSKVSELSKNNFDRLSTNVDELIRSEEELTSSLIVSFDNSVKVVAYSYDCNDKFDNDCPSSRTVDDFLPKPLLCGLQESCLCYFKQNDRRFEDPIDCVGYNKKVVFVVNKDLTKFFSNAKDYKSSGNLNFILYPTSDFGSQEFMINKKESNEIITLTFSS